MNRELFYKSEGVRDCVKWLEKEIKSGKYLTPASIKISLEKYMKKLIHEANGETIYDAYGDEEW